MSTSLAPPVCLLSLLLLLPPKAQDIYFNQECQIRKSCDSHPPCHTPSADLANDEATVPHHWLFSAQLSHIIILLHFYSFSFILFHFSFLFHFTFWSLGFRSKDVHCPWKKNLWGFWQMEPGDHRLRCIMPMCAIGRPWWHELWNVSRKYDGMFSPSIPGAGLDQTCMLARALELWKRF